MSKTDPVFDPVSMPPEPPPKKRRLQMPGHAETDAMSKALRLLVPFDKGARERIMDHVTRHMSDLPTQEPLSLDSRDF